VGRRLARPPAHPVGWNWQGLGCAGSVRSGPGGTLAVRRALVRSNLGGSVGFWGMGPLCGLTARPVCWVELAGAWACRFRGALVRWNIGGSVGPWRSGRVRPSGVLSAWPLVRTLRMRYIAISLNKNTHAPFFPTHGYHFVLDSRRGLGYSAEFRERLTPRMPIFTGFARLTDRTVPLVAWSSHGRHENSENPRDNDFWIFRKKSSSHFFL